MLFANYPMLTMVIDEDELHTGNRREGLFMGVGSFLFKPADSLGPIISLSILEWINYEKNAPTQAAPVLNSIKFLLFVIPAIFALISLIFIYYFPLHGSYFKDIQLKLKTIHKEKKEDYFLGRKWRGKT